MKKFLICTLFIFSLNVLANNLKQLILDDPVKAIKSIKQLENTDEKFEKMYKAESVIASKCNYTFYYQNKINSRGFYDQDPSIYEKYVIKNKDRFKSASEGIYRIEANDYWINKIKNKKSFVIGDYRFNEIYSFDLAVWNDGDGSMHITKLLRDYQEWVGKFPKHKKVKLANSRINFIKNWLKSNKRK